MHARGTRSPGYYGYLGPEFEACLKANSAQPHRQLLGRRTYEMLNSLPERNRDEGWHKTSSNEGFLFSRTLQRSEWAALKLVKQDMLDFVRALKADDGPELRVLGSLSLVRQFADAGLLDRLKLWVCPLVLPKSGVEPIFEGWTDRGFELERFDVLDGKVLSLGYRLVGPPPQV